MMFAAVMRTLGQIVLGAGLVTVLITPTHQGSVVGLAVEMFGLGLILTGNARH